MRKGDELVHVLSHHIHLTEDQICENMRAYMINRADWIEKIGGRILKKRGESLESYIDNITMSGVPLDTIALLTVARMHKFHIGVFTSLGMWSTCATNNLKNVRFVLYKGSGRFVESVWQGQRENYLY